MKKGKDVLGIDIGGTRIKMALVDSKGRIRRQTALEWHPVGSWKKDLNGLVKAVGSFLHSHSVPRNSLLGVGIGLPGLIDVERGFVHHLVNVRGWRELPAAALLKKRLGLPVWIDNDVNVMTLGEATYGAARGYRYVICLTLGTGVGGGILFDGALYRGRDFSAGEIGHMPVSRRGSRCACGNRGCLETYVGNRAIVRLVRRRLRSGERSRIVRMLRGRLDQLTPEVISRAARAGDRLALSVWEEVAEWLGMALSGIVNFYNPDRIVIGGGVAEAGEVLFRPLRKVLKKRTFAVPMRGLQVVRAKLGNQAGVVGASVLVRRMSE